MDWNGVTRTVGPSLETVNGHGKPKKMKNIYEKKGKKQNKMKWNEMKWNDRIE